MDVKVGNKIRVLDEEEIGYPELTSGKTYEVIDVDWVGDFIIRNNNGKGSYIVNADFEYVEKVAE